MKILVVGGAGMIGGHAALHLAGRGHQVTIAVHGAKACECAARQEFDLILMDLQMPVMGGLAATRKIRSRESAGGRHIPIVAMTAHAAKEDQKRCEEAGMDGYVSKPIRKELLRSEIKRVTEKSVPPGAGETPEVPENQPRGKWDLEELLERLEGDQDFLRELLVIFRQDAQTNMEKSRGALASGDFEELARAAHTLKGMLKNLAMGGGAQQAAALEDAARKGMAEESSERLAQLTKELEGLFSEVEAQLAEVKP